MKEIGRVRRKRKSLELARSLCRQMGIWKKLIPEALLLYPTRRLTQRLQTANSSPATTVACSLLHLRSRQSSRLLDPPPRQGRAPGSAGSPPGLDGRRSFEGPTAQLSNNSAKRLRSNNTPALAKTAASSAHQRFSTPAAAQRSTRGGWRAGASDLSRASKQWLRPSP